MPPAKQPCRASRSARDHRSRRTSTAAAPPALRPTDAARDRLAAHDPLAHDPLVRHALVGLVDRDHLDPARRGGQLRLRRGAANQ